MSPSSGLAGARVASTRAERLKPIERAATLTPLITAVAAFAMRKPGAAITIVPVVDAPIVTAVFTTYLLVSPAIVIISPAIAATPAPPAVVTPISVEPTASVPVTVTYHAHLTIDLDATKCYLPLHLLCSTV